MTSNQQTFADLTFGGKQLKLKDATSHIVDSEHKSAPESEEGYPYVKTSDIEQGRINFDEVSYVDKDSYQDWTRRLTPEPGDVVLTREAPVGRVGIIPEEKEICLGQRTVLIRPDPDILDNNYLRYLLLSESIQNRLHSLSTGSTVDHLNLSDLRSFELPPLPDIEEQRKIGELLSNFDKKIDTNKQINAILEEIGQTIFKNRFIDFKPYDSFTESELGDIPKDFQVKEISEFAEIILGNSPNSDYYNEEGEGLPFFQGSKNFGLRYPEIERWCTKEKKVADEDDVLISIRAPVGDVNRAQKKCVVGRGVTALRMKEYSNEFLYHLLKANKQNWQKYKSGTTFNSINKTDIQEFPVPLPPSQEIERFNNIARSVAKIIKNNVEENDNLVGIRHTMLPKLISGEIRVNDIELDELEVDSEV